MKDDSIDGIYETLKQCAIISKSAGGIGLNIHCIRAMGSYIAGTNGISNGLVPMLRVYNNTARYVDQGGNKVIWLSLESWTCEKNLQVFVCCRNYLASWCFCHLSGTVACGRVWIFGPEEKHGQRREPRSRFVLRPLDPWSFYATRGIEWRLVADVSARVPRLSRYLGWRVWSALYQVSDASGSSSRNPFNWISFFSSLLLGTKPRVVLWGKWRRNNFGSPS